MKIRHQLTLNDWSALDEARFQRRKRKLRLQFLKDLEEMEFPFDRVRFNPFNQSKSWN